MITAERCPAERVSVYTVRCDNCRTWRQVTVTEPVMGDVTHSNLRRRVGFESFADADLCRDCFKKTVGDSADLLCPRCAWAEEDCVCKPAIASSWDVSNGEVRAVQGSPREGRPARPAEGANVTKGVYGGTVTVTVGDGWTDTPAKTREKVGRFIREEASRVADELKRDRFRAAMAGMANVMAQVRSVLYELRDELRDWQDAQRESSSALHATCWQPEDRERMSALWSAKVREGVARIKPPGPVVRCQSEED